MMLDKKAYVSVGLFAFGSLQLAQAVMAKAEKQTNVLFIMTDQQRWDALGCAGNPEIKTPNLDRLAREGVHFTNAYSACPVCVPARSSILTGRTIFNVNVLSNADIEKEDIPDIPTFDQVLSGNGYQTEYYGKWRAS